MSQLVNAQLSTDLAGLVFGSLIKTDITLKNNKTATILTFLSDPQMFDTAASGVSRGLRSGGIAESWQSRVYTLKSGTIRPFATYNTVTVDPDRLDPEIDLKRQMENLTHSFTTLQSEHNRAIEDLINARTKIQALRLCLELNGIEVPENLK